MSDVAVRWILAVTTGFALAGCGSRTGQSMIAAESPAATAAAATNSAPTFTSGSEATTPENGGRNFYQATATDPDGDSLSFSLVGGVDRPALRIASTGELSFHISPDFEVPADADRDNIYLVRMAVSDGTTSSVRDLAVTVSNVGPDAFQVRLVGSGFAEPLFLAPVPDGSGRVFVVQKSGLVRILNPNTGVITTTPFLDLTGQVSTAGERGLLGFATAPDFISSGIFYVYVTNPAGTIEIRRYRTASESRDRANPASGNVILSIPHPSFTNHNGGWIGFGRDGALYIATGDGGGTGDPNNNAQNRNVLLGKVLRIFVNRDAFPDDPARDYAVPSNNPFVGGGGRPEIWVYGLRNPFRASFDPVTAQLWIGDVGQNAREEIDRLAPSDRGSNLGWDVLEGTATFSGAAQAGMVPPVAEYLHGTGPRQGNSVTGGYVYRGPVEALRGQYFFGDFVRGNRWSIPVRQVRLGSTIPSSAFILRNADFTPNQGVINNISSFGVDQASNLYIVDFDGEIFRVELR